MKKLCVSLIVVIGLLSVGMFGNKAFATCSATHFPYGFLCPDDAGNPGNTNIMPANNTTFTAGSTQTITISYTSQGAALQGSHTGRPPNIIHPATKVLDWLRITPSGPLEASSGLSSPLSLANIIGSAGGTTDTCPGTGAPNHGTVINDDDPQQPSGGNDAQAAILAATSVTPPPRITALQPA